MKKVLSAVAVSAFIFTANYGVAGSPSMKTEGCPEDCQQQIDSLQSSQARQDEQIKAQAGQINNQTGIIEKQAEEISALSQKEVNPWYIKATARLAMVGDMDIEGFAAKVETDTGYGGGLALGRQFGNFRVEGELATQKSDLKAFGSGDVRIDTAMINGVYDIPVYGQLSVYGTVGMGVGKVDLTVEQLDDSETTFAYKGGLGLSYAFAENMAVDVGYEYLATSDINIDGVEIEDIKSNNIIAAFRYSF